MIRRFNLLLLSALLLPLPATATPVEESDGAPRALTHDDYDSWKSIVSPRISDDGRWVLYAETPQDGEAHLVVVNVDDGRTHRHPIGYSGEGTDSERAFRGTFTADNRHVVFLISPSKQALDEAADKNKKKKGSAPKPVKSLGVLELADGQISTIDRVKNFQVPEEAGGWLAYHMEKDEAKPKGEDKEEKTTADQRPGAGGSDDDDKKEAGTDLVLRSLNDGTHTTFHDVTQYRLGRHGKRLYFIRKAKEMPEQDGFYLQDTAGGEPRSLLSGQGSYSGLVFDEEEKRLALMVDRRDSEEDKTPHFQIYGGTAGDQPALWIDSGSDALPENLAVSDKSPLRLSDDGSVLLFGLREPEPAEEEEDGEDNGADEEPEARFDLWHWDDPYPQPQQKRMARQIRNDTFETLYYPATDEIVRLADEELPDINLSDDGRRAWAHNPWPYTREVSYDGRYADIWVIDPTSGERTLVARRKPGRAALSPGGRYLSWFSDGDWFAHDIEDGSTTNLTSGLEPSFSREDHDTPQAPGSYGIAGWTNDDAHLLVYDRFDIWAISPDGANRRMITEGAGRKERISFRYLRLDPDENSIDPDAELLLRAVNEETRAEGFYRDRVSGDDQPGEVLVVDAALALVARADNADRLLLRRQSFSEYPDLWVSDLTLSEPRKLTDLGAQTDPFIWGRAELRDFLSSDGQPLKGILIKPDNYDPALRYPVMVYIYETLNQGLHRFRNPGPGTSINPSYYVSNGYVLWMPDIEYTTGYPGQDALKCVLPGVNMLIREGIADPDAIGIQGHSWGGYQITYMVTQTNIFKAAEAGAPVSNMVSAYGGIRWQSGMVRQFQYERTQSRLGASLWEVPMRYLENSPIFWLDKVQTPLLILHNDEDGAVPWYQGIELIMGLRRLGKEAYMFNYNGEAHGLRKRVNQKDFTIRMAEFFDHHLRGAPKPAWMEEGIQAWEKDSPSRP